LIGAAKIGFRGQFRIENEGFFDADSEGFVKVIFKQIWTRLLASHSYGCEFYCAKLVHPNCFGGRLLSLEFIWKPIKT
jgi:hypothetical protein